MTRLLVLFTRSPSVTRRFPRHLFEVTRCFGVFSFALSKTSLVLWLSRPCLGRASFVAFPDHFRAGVGGGSPAWCWFWSNFRAGFIALSCLGLFEAGLELSRTMSAAGVVLELSRTISGLVLGLSGLLGVGSLSFDLNLRNFRFNLSKTSFGVLVPFLASFGTSRTISELVSGVSWLIGAV